MNMIMDIIMIIITIINKVTTTIDIIDVPRYAKQPHITINYGRGRYGAPYLVMQLWRHQYAWSSWSGRTPASSRDHVAGAPMITALTTPVG